MPIVDRLEFPRRHKIKDTAILLILVAAILGFFVTRCNSKAQDRRIVIHRVWFEEISQNYVLLGFVIENKGSVTEKVNLVAKVFDKEGKQVASRLFQTTVPPGTKDVQTEPIEKWSRYLPEGEKPARASLEIHKRRLLGF